MGDRARPSRRTVLTRVWLLFGVPLALGAAPATAGLPSGARSGGPDTFWLDLTNLALGLATLEACLWVACGIEQQLAFRRRLRRVTAGTSSGLFLIAALVLAPSRAGATVEMQNQAKNLGFPIKNCLDCHATPHAVDVMHQKAKDLKMADGNCLACHGGKIPIGLNQRGEWLVAERARRGATEFDMAWLKDYKEPAPAAKPAAAKSPGAKPDPVQLAPRPYAREEVARPLSRVERCLDDRHSGRPSRGRPRLGIARGRCASIARGAPRWISAWGHGWSGPS